jgi:uncharacterized protein
MPATLSESPDHLAVGLTHYLAKADAPAPAMISPAPVEPADAAAMAAVGITRDRKKRTGTYIQRDFYPLCLANWTRQIELLPLAVALARYDWLRAKYYWHAVPADFDEITAHCAAAREPQGFFVRVKKGAQIALPVEACLYMARDDTVQAVHNIVILEEGASLNLVTGCTMHAGIQAGVHLGVTENYVGPNAQLTATMVHSWGAETIVRPRVGTMVARGGRYTDSYCSLRPAQLVESQPRTWLDGKGSTAKHMTVILGSRGSTVDIGGEVFLNGEDSRAELAHRAVCTGGQIYQRGLLIGNARCRAHVDCAGLILDAGEGGLIQSIPGLQALHPEAQMSHEASIGRIAPEQVEYLQTRGLDERAAISMIVRGFLGADIAGLGTELDAQIAELTELAGHGEK